MSAETTSPHPIATATPPLLKSARGLGLILQAADLNGLPLPFSVSAYDYNGTVDLQFHTRAQVVEWAMAMGVPAVDEVDLPAGAMVTRTQALGEIHEVPVRAVSSVRVAVA